MKKQLIIPGIIVILITVGLTGCTDTNNGGDNSKFVGTWIGTETIPDVGVINIGMTFFSNGTLDISGGEGVLKNYGRGYWDIDHGLLVISSVYWKKNYFYSFYNNDKSLRITATKNDDEIFLTKQ